MNDDELRQLLREAHADDAPPAFSPRRARRRARWMPAVAVALAMAAVAIWWAARPRPEVSVASLEVRVHCPLDFLLDVPGADVLRTVPTFDTKETWP
jgi:hypothetical protein